MLPLPTAPRSLSGFAVARERGDSISIDIAQDPYNLAMFTGTLNSTAAQARPLNNC